MLQPDIPISPALASALQRASRPALVEARDRQQAHDAAMLSALASGNRAKRAAFPPMAGCDGVDPFDDLGAGT